MPVKPDDRISESRIGQLFDKQVIRVALGKFLAYRKTDALQM